MLQGAFFLTRDDYSYKFNLISAIYYNATVFYDKTKLKARFYASFYYGFLIRIYDLSFQSFLTLTPHTLQN